MGARTMVCQGLHGEYFRLGSQTWSHHPHHTAEDGTQEPILLPWVLPEQNVHRTLRHGGCCSTGLAGAQRRLKDSNALAFWLLGNVPASIPEE